MLSQKKTNCNQLAHPTWKCHHTNLWIAKLSHLTEGLLRSFKRWKLLPSVLWHCCLGGRRGIRPVKNWVVRCWHGYLSGARCRLAYGSADATATHCLLLQKNPDWFYLVPAHLGSPGKKAVKWVCVCVCVFQHWKLWKEPVVGCHRWLWKQPVVICGNWNVRHAMSQQVFRVTTCATCHSEKHQIALTARECWNVC